MQSESDNIPDSTKEMKQYIKNGLYITGGIAFVGIVATGAYVFGHKPDVVESPCFRSCYRADGCPKVAFDKAWKANWQCVKQLFRYGEVCNSYQVGDKFYTGHSKNAFCRNINPFKKTTV